MSRHVHLEVIGHAVGVGGSFCMWEFGSWRPAPEDGLLVIGHGVPRMMIPLMNIALIKVIDAPEWCRREEPE